MRASKHPTLVRQKRQVGSKRTAAAVPRWSEAQSSLLGMECRSRSWKNPVEGLGKVGLAGQSGLSVSVAAKGGSW